MKHPHTQCPAARPPHAKARRGPFPLVRALLLILALSLLVPALRAGATISSPGAVTDYKAVGGQRQVTVTFSAPLDNGGSAITHYLVSLENLSTATFYGKYTIPHTGTGPYSQVFTGLTYGVSYFYRISAYNATGSSMVFDPVTPTATAPGPVTAVSAAGGQRQATVNFSAPKDDGGVDITQYAVSFVNKATGASAGTYTIPHTGAGSYGQVFTGLTYGTVYTYSITAKNAVGSGTAVTGEVTPTAAVPGPVTAVKATGGHRQATVSFAAPNGDFGADITEYTVSLVNKATGASAGSFTILHTAAGLYDHVFTGLTYGTTYTYSIIAKNAVGSGTAVTGEVTPTVDIPSPVTSVSAVGGQLQATVSFAAPHDDGGADITQYTVSLFQTDNISSVGSYIIKHTGAGPYSQVFTGLTYGTAYTYSIDAKNALGNSEPMTGEVTPTATVPGPVTGAGATGKNGQSTLVFSAPASDGGAPVTAYSIAYFVDGNLLFNPEDVVHTGAGPYTLTFPDPPFGKTITYYIRAINAIGAGAEQGVSVPLTLTVPGAPLITGIQTGIDFATVSFSPPRSDGGSPITGYILTATGPSGKTITVQGAASPLTVRGLLPGVAYTFRVKASNIAGEGLPSAASAPMSTQRYPQTIVVTDPGEQPVGSGIDLTQWMKSDAGLPLTFTAGSANVTIKGNSAAFLAPGAALILADQPGDASHEPAARASLRVQVTALAPEPEPGDYSLRLLADGKPVYATALRQRYTADGRSLALLPADSLLARLTELDGPALLEVANERREREYAIALDGVLWQALLEGGHSLEFHQGSLVQALVLPGIDPDALGKAFGGGFSLDGCQLAVNLTRASGAEQPFEACYEALFEGQAHQLP